MTSETVLFSALLLAVAFNSCTKSDSKSDNGGNGTYTAQASFTIDGDGFKQQTVTIKGIKESIDNCAYWNSGKITTSDIVDAPNINTGSKNDFHIVFNGNKPGTQKSGTDANGGPYSSVYFTVSVTSKDGKKHDYVFLDKTNTPGTITITKYGAVGETVEGTFSGTLIDANANPDIHISNGTFAVTRNPDIN